MYSYIILVRWLHYTYVRQLVNKEATALLAGRDVTGNQNSSKEVNWYTQDHHFVRMLW